tara:strand:+ start:4350 stop:4487 length:138 start_codon:yes stop_codon:yes gene_type:complete
MMIFKITYREVTGKLQGSLREVLYPNQQLTGREGIYLHSKYPCSL